MRGLARHDEAESTRQLLDLQRTKWLLWQGWLLWHGNQCRAQQHAGDLRGDVECWSLTPPHLGRFARAAQEFAVCTVSNAGSLINYGEEFRSDKRISSAMVESTIVRCGQQALAYAVDPAQRSPAATNPYPSPRPHSDLFEQ